jgi:hypothetical protein
MQKIYLMLTSATLIFVVACGGKEEKKEEKKEKSEETEEPKEEEAKVDYSYVIPQIDTASLTDEASLMDAMTKVVKARKMDDSLHSAVSGYDGYYIELTNLYAAVLSKGTAFANTLKPKDAIAFHEKFSAAQN